MFHSYISFIFLSFFFILCTVFFWYNILFESDLLKRLKLILFRSSLKLEKNFCIYEMEIFVEFCWFEIAIRLQDNILKYKYIKADHFPLKLVSIHEKAIIYNQIPVENCWKIEFPSSSKLSFHWLNV